VDTRAARGHAAAFSARFSPAITAVSPDRTVSNKEGWPHYMIDIMMPKIETIGGSEEEYQGRYQIEPLERGFGQTVGNAMRRVLLSSLPGAAVTSIKIDNVYHEFSAVEDVKEDITELILNVKQIRLKSFSDRPIQCRLEASGGGLVTAADIICPPEIEVFNPELQLATLDGPESRLSFELTVERGRGYVPADHREGLPIGVIPVDAIYTPVRRVNFAVEPTRVGGATDYERLVLDVTTDGTISPDEAVSESAKILIRHFELLSNLVASKTGVPVKLPAGNGVIPPKLYDTPIEDLDLTVRAYNCLKRAGITKIGQVLEMTEDDLLGVRNFGRKSLEELRERLASRDLLKNSRLAGPPPLQPAIEDEEETAEAAEDEEEEPEIAFEGQTVEPVEDEFEAEEAVKVGEPEVATAEPPAFEDFTFVPPDFEEEEDFEDSGGRGRKGRRWKREREPRR
jgi:DNA-directed RNA polymerase subunit alpha